MVQRSILWTVTASVLTLPSWSQGNPGNYVPVVQANYAPPEVAVPHAAHKLTVFLPRVCPPPDTDLYPILLYSPASMFASTESGASLETGLGEFQPLPVIEVPGGGGGGHFGALHCRPGDCSPLPSMPAPSPPPSSGLGFIAEALATGWAVVTVGTTGWNSWPTCAQLEDCNPCNLGSNPGCGSTGSCWDTNLWYGPSTPQWNDFNVFWGEKEFLWARQWVGENALAYGLDNDRVVVSGTSTGSIYASFLAFGPNRAWDASHSTQAQQDTRVAGIVAFEPNTWIKGLGDYWPAVHWPSDDTGMICGSTGGSCFGMETCYNRRAVSLGLDAPVVPGVLEQSSISRWVREIEDASERPTPAFIAAGDGLITTDFQRDANVFTTDYDRYSGEPGILVEGDPLLSFTAFPDELRLHDSWYAMNFALDLELLDAANGDTFHEENSRLFLQDGHTWSYLPDWLSTTGNPPQAADEVLGLDGTYAYELVQSIDNPDLATQAVAWMEEVLDIQRTSAVVFRNPPLVGPGSVPNPNPPIFSSPPVVLNTPTEVEVDLNGAPGYELASVLVFTSPSAPGAELVLSAGQALLCDIGSYLFSLPFDTQDADGVVRLTLGPAAPACVTFYTQAILVDTQHAMPFALTNALDITVQPGP